MKCVIAQRHLHSYAARILDGGWGTRIVANMMNEVIAGLPAAAAQDRLLASGLIALLIGVILVARSPALAAAPMPPTPGFEVHPAWKMAATGSWRLRRRKGVGHGCGQEGKARGEGSQEQD